MRRLHSGNRKNRMIMNRGFSIGYNSGFYTKTGGGKDITDKEINEMLVRMNNQLRNKGKENNE